MLLVTFADLVKEYKTQKKHYDVISNIKTKHHWSQQMELASYSADKLCKVVKRPPNLHNDMTSGIK